MLIMMVLGATAARVYPADSRVVSAFSTVGVRGPSGEAPAVTLYVVPDGKTFLLTDVLVTNHGQEVGPLYLSDSRGTRCSIALLQATVIANAPGGLYVIMSPHTTFSSGIPFGPGEPVTATVAGAVNGLDVTISGKLLPGPHVPKAVRLPGGARDDTEETPGQ